MEMFEYGNPRSNIVLIQPVDDHDLEGIENEVAEIVGNCNTSFHLIAVRIDDWNKDLSPWKAPAVFGKDGFGSDASKTLCDLLELCSDKSKTYYIGGYSLAGLFALWAAYQTDAFSGVAAASPSMWFPGFLDFVRKNEMLVKPERVYFSLGDKEAKTRNQMLRTVEDNTKEICELIKNNGIESIFEMNEGNHFKDADLRLAKGIKWICEN